MPWMDANKVARVGIKSLGKKSAVIPGTINNVMIFVMTRLMPSQFAMNMFGNMMAKIMDPQIVDYAIEAASA